MPCCVVLCYAVARDGVSHSWPADVSVLDYTCHVQVNGSLGAWWASVDGQGVWNVTGSTNNMQASECDEHCNWNDQQASLRQAMLQGSWLG
jgi:hypothetical protein